MTTPRPQDTRARRAERLLLHWWVTGAALAQKAEG